MNQTIRRTFWLIASFLFTFGLIYTVGSVAAQQTPSQIFISGTDPSSAPTIQLHVYAIDGQGNPVTLDPSSLKVEHNGVDVGPVEIGSPYKGGTFTVFLLDLTNGVSAQIPTIQEAITQFAAEPNMVEQVDSVAIFAVDELAATQILPPTDFYNTVINTFASGLTPSSGSTALIDSLMGLINNVESLKPRPDMITQIVVMSDGTDSVSTQFTEADVPRRAAELGIPVHTVALTNSTLAANNSQAGQEYLSQVASGSLAQSVILNSAGDLQPIWDHIAAFRDQTTVQYSLTEAVGGDYPVKLSLANNPNVSDETTVTIPAGAPTVVINLPEDSRSLTLPNLDQPVALSFSTDIAWMDGVEREITKAQLLANGIVVQEIDPGTVDQFEVQLSNLVFGPNQIQIAVVDDQGSRAVSPQIVLNIAQGETQIPEAVAPKGLGARLWERLSGAVYVVGGCLLLIVVFALIAGITIAGRRSPLLHQLRLVPFMRRIPFLRPYFQDIAGLEYKAQQVSHMKQKASRYAPEVKGARASSQKGPKLAAFLEVIEAATQMPGRIDLSAVEVHLGRSANQADVVFKNDGTVSRVHATIVQEGNDYRIFDEQSTSGTFVNEQGVPEYGIQLVDGDEIRLGAVRLRFRRP